MSASVCEKCGAKTVEYRHNLSDFLVTALARLDEAGGGPLNIMDLDLTRNQWDNFQKLRYFDLVEQVSADDGRRKAGYWRITEHGRRFIRGEDRSPLWVWTYRGEKVRYDGPPMSVGQVSSARYKQRWEWADEAEPHEEEDGDDDGPA